MPSSKAILSAEEAGNHAFEYVMPKLQSGVPGGALSIFQSSRDKKNDFRLAEAMKLKTGVSQMEAKSNEEEVERKMLEKLKEVQEAAYKEAFQLGLIEGRKQAFEKSDAELKSKIDSFSQLIESIGSLKKELLVFNEAHLIKLVFHMAQRLAHREILTHPEAIVEVIRQAIEKAQGEEEIVVQVSPEQIKFLEELKTETQRDLDFLKKVQLQPNDSISAGGCIIETNYGEIDSRFEERVGKIWETLIELMPQSKDKVSAA